jgi:hypothetical protein
MACSMCVDAMSFALVAKQKLRWSSAFCVDGVALVAYV